MADRKTRILGKMLGQYIGKEVIVAGNITEINEAAGAVELTTFDKTKINITIPRSFEVSTSGIYEIWGTAKSRGTMLASQCVRFEEDACTDFDPQKYNDVLVTQHALNDRKWKINANSNPL